MAKDAPGMRGNRSRNQAGPLRRKQGNTHVGTVEAQYNKDFGVNSNMHLKTLLKKEGVTSLNDLLNGK